VQHPIYFPCCGTLEHVAVDGSASALCPRCGQRTADPPTAEVFVSFSFADMDKAEQCARHLHAAGLSHWFAPDLGPGHDFADEIVTALQSARALLLLLSPTCVASSWVRGEIALARKNRVPWVLVKLEDFEVPDRLVLELGTTSWENAYERDLSWHLDRVVESLRRVVRERAAGGDRPATAAAASRRAPTELAGVQPRVPPYVGPQPFPPERADAFFGRHDDARLILELVDTSSLLLIYAPSGAGKSSILNTLVRRSLEQAGWVVLPSTRVGSPAPASADRAEAGPGNVFTYSALLGLAGHVPVDPACGLVEFLAATPGAGERRRVLIIDQFEEIFTHHKTHYQQRDGFVDELVEAIRADPDLRVVLAMRQEYLADVDVLVERLPKERRPARYFLRRLDEAKALEAVVRPAAPFARFAPGVAEEIVRQLRREHVEAVYLQVVCHSLWRKLPEGTKVIEMEHLTLAAGPGRGFGDFVANALVEFYEETIRGVARESGYPAELIRLGCMKFVHTAGARLTIQRENGQSIDEGRTGRLPNRVVEQLESRHLVRAEQRGGERWYELSHDLLADPVSRGRDHRASQLLAATDLLATMLTRLRAENGGALRNVFAAHDDLLRECKPFLGQPGLFQDESEFLLRSSLATGTDARDWSERVRQDFPEVHRAVLAEALASERGAVRSGACRVLGRSDVPALDDELVRLGMEDEDRGVRRAAAEALARRDRPELLAAVAAAVRTDASRRAAIRALAEVSLHGGREGERGAAFERVLRDLPLRRRSVVRLLAVGRRMAEFVPVAPYLVIPATLLSAAAAAAFKWLPAHFNWALCQASGSWAMGVFHGATAGVLWAGCISFALALHRFVFERPGTPRSILRPFLALLFGGVGGCISGLAVTFIVVGVYEMNSLVEMGWLNDASALSSRIDGALLHDLFVRTRFGWAYAITGFSLGVGMAMISNGLAASGQLAAFLDEQTGIDTLAQARRILGGLTRLVLRYGWCLAATLALGGLGAALILRPGEHALEAKRGVALGTAMDCGSQLVGGLAALVGMGLGIVVMHYGVRVAPRRQGLGPGRRTAAERRASS
jgi:hypothetical protein